MINKDISLTMKSKNKKEYLKKQEPEQKTDIIDINIYTNNIRNSSDDVHRLIFKDKGTLSSNKNIQKNNPLTLPNISQMIKVKKKEPVSRHFQIANEKL